MGSGLSSEFAPFWDRAWVSWASSRSPKDGCRQPAYRHSDGCRLSGAPGPVGPILHSLHQADAPSKSAACRVPRAGRLSTELLTEWMSLEATMAGPVNFSGHRHFCHTLFFSARLSGNSFKSTPCWWPPHFQPRRLTTGHYAIKRRHSLAQCKFGWYPRCRPRMPSGSFGAAAMAATRRTCAEAKNQSMPTSLT
jgi:hypothetical protein